MTDGFKREASGIVRRGIAAAASEDGASSGDAATVGPDGELLFAAASGGSQPQRNVGQCEFDFNGFDGSGAVPLVFSAGDAAMVDLTDPTYPNVVVPGIYAYNVTLGTNTFASSGIATLIVDDNYYSIAATTDIGNRLASICIVWFCDAGDPFRLNILGSGGTISGSVYVQKIA